MDKSALYLPEKQSITEWESLAIEWNVQYFIGSSYSVSPSIFELPKYLMLNNSHNDSHYNHRRQH